MHRFFAASAGRIAGEEARHLFRVLRLAPGDEIEVLLGGRRYLARLISAAKEEALYEPLVELPSREPACRVTLYQGLCKGERMDFIAQKCTEMGIFRIVPVLMARSEAKFEGAAKLERLRRIAAEAVKQCGRSLVPEIAEPLPFSRALSSMGVHKALLMPYEGGGAPPAAPIPQDVGLLIGPEGGIAPEEAAAIGGIGGRALTLGPRVLRAETAGLVALSLTLFLAGALEACP
ncbi:MAG: 16S rRNA (uracil(1498)-N(3))-methyltransferase [Christensenellaceae bacterium]|nr:16S rRNA (uracil(1498)-N(3))-methyltransferase [Christensenellaceae bacterium]